MLTTNTAPPVSAAGSSSSSATPGSNTATCISPTTSPPPPRRLNHEHMAVLNQLLSNGCASAGTIGGPSPTTTTIILRAEIPALGLRKAIRVHRMDVPRVIVGQILDKANLEGAQFVGWRLYRVGVRAVDADAVSVPAASVPVAAATTLTSSTATATATTTVPAHDDLLQQQRHARDEQQHVERPSGTWLDDEVPLAEQSHGRAWRDHDIVQLLPSSEGHIGPPVRVASAAHSSAAHSSTAHSSTAHSSTAHSSAAHSSTGSSAARPSTGGGATHSSSATSTQSTGIYSPRITPSASIAVQPHNTAPPASIIKKFGKIAAKSSTIVSKKINKARETTKGKLSTFSSSTTFAHGKTFGMPLDVVPCDTHGVPLVIEMALQHLRARDMRTEGLFRLSGAASAVQALKDAFDRDGAVDGKAAMDACLDGHAVAGLVKLFLREMPEPLLTFELYDAWIAAQASSVAQLRIYFLFQLTRALPRSHYRLLQRLCLFFHELAQFGEFNKMTWQNLATVLGPNITRDRNESAIAMVHNTGAVNNLAMELIRHAPTLFTADGSHFYAAYPTFERMHYVAVASALFAYESQQSAAAQQGDQAELSFKAGDTLLIVSKTPFGGEEQLQHGENAGWWIGEVVGGDVRIMGLVPANYVEVRAVFAEDAFVVVDEDAVDALALDETTEADHSPSTDITTSIPSPSARLSASIPQQQPLQSSRRSSSRSNLESQHSEQGRQPDTPATAASMECASHNDELASLKETIAALLAENKLLRVQRDSLKNRLERAAVDESMQVDQFCQVVPSHLDQSCQHIPNHIDQFCQHIPNHVDQLCQTVPNYVDQLCQTVPNHVDQFCQAMPIHVDQFCQTGAPMHTASSASSVSPLSPESGPISLPNMPTALNDTTHADDNSGTASPRASVGDDSFKNVLTSLRHNYSQRRPPPPPPKNARPASLVVEDLLKHGDLDEALLSPLASSSSGSSRPVSAVSPLAADTEPENVAAKSSSTFDRSAVDGRVDASSPAAPAPADENAAPVVEVPSRKAIFDRFNAVPEKPLVPSAARRDQSVPPTTRSESQRVIAVKERAALAEVSSNIVSPPPPPPLRVKAAAAALATTTGGTTAIFHFPPPPATPPGDESE